MDQELDFYKNSELMTLDDELDYCELIIGNIDKQYNMETGVSLISDKAR